MLKTVKKEANYVNVPENFNYAHDKKIKTDKININC